MPKALTIKIGYVSDGGVFTPWGARAVYMKPSRTDITLLNAGGYIPWNINQNGDPGYQDCWKAVTNASGVATFAAVPFTDTEMHRPKDPGGAPIGPEIEWNFINPHGSNGTIVYSGKLLSTMTLGATVNVPDDLMQLNTNAWRVSGAAYMASPMGGTMQAGTVTFPAGVTQMAIVFTPNFSTPPRVLLGGCYDKAGNHSMPGFSQDGSGADQITNANALCQVAAGLVSDVRVPFIALGA